MILRVQDVGVRVFLVKNLMTNFIHPFVIIAELYLWQMLVQIPMEVNFLLYMRIIRTILTVAIVSLERLLSDGKW